MQAGGNTEWMMLFCVVDDHRVLGCHRVDDSVGQCECRRAHFLASLVILRDSSWCVIFSDVCCVNRSSTELEEKRTTFDCQ